MTTTSKSSVLRLNWKEDDDTKVVVTPSNQDRYVKSVKNVIEACQAQEAAERSIAQFQYLLTRLGEWVRDHHDKIAQAYVTVRDVTFLFLVVQKSKAYDAELEEALTDVDLEIALSDEFSALRLSVLALPSVAPDSRCAFLDDNFALEYHHRDA